MIPSSADEPSRIDDSSLKKKEDRGDKRTENQPPPDPSSPQKDGQKLNQEAEEARSSQDPPPVETPQKEQTLHGEFRTILQKVHVVDILPERSTVCTVDSGLPIYEILTSLLAICHRSREAWQSDNPTTENAANPPIQAEPVATFLSSNILAEVCEFSPEDSQSAASPTVSSPAASGHKRQRSDRPSGESSAGEAAEEDDDTGTGQHRNWTGIDDGWGQAQGSPTVGVTEPEVASSKEDPYDLLFDKFRNEAEGEAMGWLQMPFTVTELAEFLLHSLSGDGSILDWDLSHWRRYKEESILKKNGIRGRSLRQGSLFTELPLSPQTSDQPNLIPSPSTLMQLIQGGSVPPRPMLRIEDPESTFLRAVEILLAHPELSALPVVSMVQRTVVAHLTLSQCLALLLQHFRGEEIAPLAEITLSETPQHILRWQNEKQSEVLASKDGVPKDSCICMDADKDTLRDLLEFFSKTNFTAVPIITENNFLIGVIGRRNLLQLLDISMESSYRVQSKQANPGEDIPFDVTWPLRQVIETLERYTPPNNNRFFGTGFTTEILPLSILLCEILLSDNHKVVVVEPHGEHAVLRQFIHVDEVMRTLLFGDGDLPESLRTDLALVEADTNHLRP